MFLLKVKNLTNLPLKYLSVAQHRIGHVYEASLWPSFEWVPWVFGFAKVSKSMAAIFTLYLLCRMCRPYLTLPGAYLGTYAWSTAICCYTWSPCFSDGHTCSLI